MRTAQLVQNRNYNPRTPKGSAPDKVVQFRLSSAAACYSTICLCFATISVSTSVPAFVAVSSSSPSVANATGHLV